MLANHTQHRESRTTRPLVLVVGVGNDYRCDDSAGLLVARQLMKVDYSKLAPATVNVIECAGDNFNLMDEWEGADLLILVDAISSGADPGTVFRIEVHNRSIPTYMFHQSTHSFTVAHTLELSRLLGKLPRRVVIFGIEGVEFDHGEAVSDEIARAVDGVTHSILDLIQDWIEEKTANKGKT